MTSLGLTYDQIVWIVLLTFSAAINLHLSFWCLRFHRQRSVLYRALISSCGLYEPYPDVNGLIKVLDQIEGVKRQKIKSEVTL